MKSKTFPIGGVHPPENKLSANIPITVSPPPKSVIIPLEQHIGAPPKIIVKKGDEVKTGTLIAQGADGLSSNIHSSVTGIVKKIDSFIDKSGYIKKAIEIEIEINSSEQYEGNIGTYRDNIETLTPNEIISIIKDAGIVGLGGATFPSFFKLNTNANPPLEYLLINGVECEPYLTSDHRIMLEKSNELLLTIKLLIEKFKFKKAIIGIENNKSDAIALLSKLSKNIREIDVYPLKVKYPQGAEKQLIKSCLNKDVAGNKLPSAVSTVVFNVGTIFSIYEAIYLQKPLIDRVITITGKQLKNPCNVNVRIGTPISHLLNQFNLSEDDLDKIIDGGPMMGKALTSIDVPITKGTSGILLLSKNETKRKEAQPCIRCSKCVSACAYALEPYLLATLSKKFYFERLLSEQVLHCCECGSCSYICPSNIPLLDYIRVGKNETRKLLAGRKVS